MRYREPFTLFPRHLHSGRTVWYYQTYDENGRRTTAKSTGQTTKTKAKWFCSDLLKKNELIPDKSREVTFAKLAENFFVWGECEYLKYRMTRRKLTQGYAKNARRIVINDLLPAFKHKRLKDFNRKEVEVWIQSLKEKDLKNASINLKITILTTMLNEAVRREIITHSPIANIPRLKDSDAGVRGILKADEARKLFDENQRQELWGHPVYYLINIIAACTGMRKGEILGLRPCDIQDGYIKVDHQYKQGYGITDTKTHDSRNIPLPSFIIDDLKVLGADKESDSFLFCIDRPDKPINQETVNKKLYAALEKIGISREEQQKRNICFHSWRHFFNTTMRSNNISDGKVQKLTGHTSMAMTERYTHFQNDDFKDVQEIQERMLKAV